MKRTPSEKSVDAACPTATATVGSSLTVSVCPAGHVAASPDAEGHRVAIVPYESDDYLAPRLLAFVDRIEVLKPARLRRRVVALAKRVSAMYRSPG